MIFHGYFRSSAAWRCRIAFNLKGLDHEFRAVHLRRKENQAPDYKKINPQGLVPALDVDGHIQTQSLAIIEWLDETHPEPPLLPKDPGLRADVRSFSLVIAADIHPLQNLRVLNYLGEAFGADQAAKDAWCAAWLRPGLEACESLARRQRHGGSFIFGDTPSLADICLIPQLASAARFKVDIADLGRLAEVRAACEALDAFRTAAPDAQPDAEQAQPPGRSPGPLPGRLVSCEPNEPRERDHMPQTHPILIAGGGIGGLATAIGLARRGFRSIVLEKAPELGEIGAGIQLGPNAFNAFDALGVGEIARDMAVYVDSLRLMDAVTAQEVCRIPLGAEFRHRFGNPYAVIHRGDLFRVFLRACEEHPLVELRTSAEVTGYEQDEAGVTAVLADGERITGHMLIGADGLWSNIRKQLANDGPPRVSGHTTYRSVIPTENMPEELRWNAATLWAGPKCHLVHYPLSGWKAFNLVVTYHNDAPEPVAGLPVSHEEVMRGFRHIHPKAQQIIEHGQNWKLWVLCDRDPITKWQDGRVVLLGDAAHPMMQYMAQGACMAMEDAVCIGLQIEAASGDPERAIDAYVRKRRMRTARVQLQSRWIGENVYHPAGAHAKLRNTIMKAKSPDDWYDTLQWIYGGPQHNAGELARPDLAG